MARAPRRILSQFGDAEAIKLPADLRGRVEFVHVPPSEPIPRELRGDVLRMTFVYLTEVRLRGIACYARAVPDGDPAMRVSFHA